MTQRQPQNAESQRTTERYQQTKVMGWSDLRDQLEELSQDRSWIFRGQRCASWALKTSLERHAPQDSPIARSEDKLLSEFQRRAHTYLAQQLIPKENDDGEWLALMQHFGAPTRLLDATISPYVATYFAVEDESDEPYCSVWAINQEWCYKAAGAAILAVADEAGIKNNARMTEKMNALRKEQGQGTLTREHVQGLASSQLAYAGWRSKTISAVVPYTPTRLSERLAAQQGTFLIPRDVTRAFMENLDTMPDMAQGVIKILIRTDMGMRGTILERLRAMNIHRATLFPGLEGYAQSFRTLLLQEPEDSRTASLEVAAFIQHMFESKVTDSAQPDPRPTTHTRTPSTETE